MPSQFGVITGDVISRHGGVIPAWGTAQIFGIGRIIGVGDSVGHALPLVGEGIRYSIESGRYLGDMIARSITDGIFPSKILQKYTRWWNNRYRLSFTFAQCANEIMSEYKDDDWDRDMERLGQFSSDDIGSLLRAEVSIKMLLRIFLKNPDMLWRIPFLAWKRKRKNLVSERL